MVFRRVYCTLGDSVPSIALTTRDIDPATVSARDQIRHEPVLRGQGCSHCILRGQIHGVLVRETSTDD
jgi:hypothetical protein